MRVKVHEAFNCAPTDNVVKQYTPLYGVELEYENTQVSALPFRWDITFDHSLRNGIEIISPPLGYKKMSTDLAAVLREIRRVKGKTSKRCGLHLHINMRPYDLGQFFSFITLYVLAEPTIFKTHAEGRDDSNFCVPMYLQDEQVRGISEAVNLTREQGGGVSLVTEPFGAKYSAMNFQRLRSLGTIEMRQTYSTTTTRAAQNWLKFCHLLRRYGVRYNDPAEVLKWYEAKRLSGLQTELFTRQVDVCPRAQELAEDAAYCIAGAEPVNWEELDISDWMMFSK